MYGAQVTPATHAGGASGAATGCFITARQHLSPPDAVDTAARLRAYDKERAGIRAGSPVRGDNVDADLAPGRPLVRSDVIHAEARSLMGARCRLRIRLGNRLGIRLGIRLGGQGRRRELPLNRRAE